MFWRSLFSRGHASAPSYSSINTLRAAMAARSDNELSDVVRQSSNLAEVVAATAVMAARVLGIEMHDEQLQAAVALAEGKIVEMQTGEGKTLAAVPAVVWLARTHQGVHVLTANEYLAKRDAEWMRGIYERLGFSVASIDQSMSPEARRAAYGANITYATANEVGFDYLRDGLAYDTAEMVHRSLSDVAVVIDEADSILIDEARIPLVIAGGVADQTALPVAADRAVRTLSAGVHFTVENAGRNVLLTPAGVHQVESVMRIRNLFDAMNITAHAAVQDALHAHVLLRRDVDYLVQDGAVLSVDEIKGRVVSERRWPAGLQTALECKESVTMRTQGRVLGSITVENLVALYGSVCGMSGTAAIQSKELRQIYSLDVVEIPTHRPVVRIDHADRMFATRSEKDAAVVDEIQRIHSTGQPVLVGTVSVEESERLSRQLGDLPHHVLNARHEAQEAAIVARAGALGAVTISTNMAGRGVDIALGDGVAELGGLHVIGTTRHHSRRIDNQLRGRAGRQGDPGSSQFFVSGEDALFVTYADGDPAVGVDQLQRVAEGQSLDTRLFLKKYETVIEAQRLTMRERRQAVLESGSEILSERLQRALEKDERRVTLDTLDDLWSDYLAATSELRSGTPWLSLGGKDPHGWYLGEIHGMFNRMMESIDDEIAAQMSDAGEGQRRDRGATWTYLTTDEPFGTMTERIMRHLVARFRGRKT